MDVVIYDWEGVAFQFTTRVVNCGHHDGGGWLIFSIEGMVLDQRALIKHLENDGIFLSPPRLRNKTRESKSCFRKKGPVAFGNSFKVDYAFDG